MAAASAYGAATALLPFLVMYPSWGIGAFGYGAARPPAWRGSCSSATRSSAPASGCGRRCCAERHAVLTARAATRLAVLTRRPT